MDKKICIVTGANAGIGKQAAEQLAMEGCHVIMACRNQRRGEEAKDEILGRHPELSIELMIVDMGMMQSVRDFAHTFSAKYQKLDVLIHNAAVFNVIQKRAQFTSEGIESIWATNHLGPVLLTLLLADRMKDGGRIITIASKGLLAKPFLKVDLNDPEFKNHRFNVVNAYYQSKLAQIMFTYWLAGRFKNITANCIRVTAVKIDISRHSDLSPFMKWVYSQKAKQSIEPSEMAKTYTYLATSRNLDDVTGKYFDEKNREVQSGKYTCDDKNINAVMELTKSYIPEAGNL